MAPGRIRLVVASVAMVYGDSEARAGGEYGDVRARIDDDKLNAYIASTVPAVTVPVTIKQFKVRIVACDTYSRNHNQSCLTVWPG